MLTSCPITMPVACLIPYTIGLTLAAYSIAIDPKSATADSMAAYSSSDSEPYECASSSLWVGYLNY